MDNEQIERVAKALCAETCAYMGEPPCYSVEGDWPNSGCDEPGCHTLAARAIAAMQPEPWESAVDELLPRSAEAMQPDGAFTDWLEEDHPAHSEYDHANLGAYRRWQSELRTAFNAGWKARKEADAQAIRDAADAFYQAWSTHMVSSNLEDGSFERALAAAEAYRVARENTDD